MSGDRSFAKVPWYLWPDGGFGPRGLGSGLVAGLGAGPPQRANQRRPAKHDVRTPAYAVARFLFGQTHGRSPVARISSDTDRICNFLSDSLADFVTDVLMIVGTVAVLFSLDPLLGGRDARHVSAHRLADVSVFVTGCSMDF